MLAANPVKTHVMTLVEAADGTRQWVLVGVAGHADEANLPVSSDLLSLVHLPKGFQAQVAPLVVPRTTVLVTTMARINKNTTGANLDVGGRRLSFFIRFAHLDA